MKKVLLALLVVAMSVACSKEEENKTSETNPLGYIITHFSEDYGQVSRASDCPYAVDGYLSTEDSTLVLTIYGYYSTAVVTLSTDSIGKIDEYTLTSQARVSLPIKEYSGAVDIVIMIDSQYRFTGSLTI